MLIRSAVDHDFVACIAIAKRAWPEFKERESIYHLFCKFFSNTCFVATNDDGIIQAFLLGFISQVDSTEAYIHLVAVDPPSQRQGIAERLYHVFFDTVRTLGARRIRLIVNPDNAGSIAFHEKLGFRPDLVGATIDIEGVRAVRDYNGPGIHMVPFVRSIGEVTSP